MNERMNDDATLHRRHVTSRQRRSDDDERMNIIIRSV